MIGFFQRFLIAPVVFKRCFKYETRRLYCQIIVFVFTLLCYASYHVTRKSLGVVKAVIHQANCTAYAQSHDLIIPTDNPDEFCNWEPFSGPSWSQLLGALDSTYLLSYAIGMLITGYIAERVHVTLVLSLGTILMGIFACLFGIGYYLNIHNYWYYFTSQILAGLFQGVGWPCVVLCMANWFGKTRRGLIMGTWSMNISLGNLFGTLIAGMYLEIAWGLSFIVPGLIGIFFGVATLFLLTPYPHEVNVYIDQGINYLDEDERIPLTGDKSTSMTAHSYGAIDDEKAKPIGMLSALAIPGVIEYSLCLFFSKMVSYTFLYWLPSYVYESSSFSVTDAATLSATFDVGGLFSGLIGGLISDYMDGATAIACNVMLLTSVPLLFIYYVYGATDLASSILLLIVLGLFVQGPYCLITTAVSADLGTHPSLKGSTKAIATVSAIIDSAGSIGATVGPLICGFVVVEGWLYVFIMLSISILLAAVFLIRLTVKEFRLIWRKRLFSDK